MWHNWQTAANGTTWSGWVAMGGGILTRVTVGQNADGRLEIFTINQDRAPFHMWQTSTGWSASSKKCAECTCR